MCLLLLKRWRTLSSCLGGNLLGNQPSVSVMSFYYKTETDFHYSMVINTFCTARRDVSLVLYI